MNVSIKKWVKDLNRQLRYTDGNRAYEKVLHIIVIREMQIK